MDFGKDGLNELDMEVPEQKVEMDIVEAIETFDKIGKRAVPADRKFSRDLLGFPEFTNLIANFLRRPRSARIANEQFAT